MKTINIGIDLGTTNSAIAEYIDGKVHIYKNPVGFAETLPSVVSFRKNKIWVGQKARERFLVGDINTFASFKRKMGTDETYPISHVEKTISPIELSAHVLRELCQFLPGDKSYKSAVITIPASFNTMQSNATKQAGQLAGLKETYLLQKPIAACIAYSNEQNLNLTEEEQWLVYDFGGGTFDITLASVSDRALTVTDHRGDNFLGGVDIDQLIVEHILCKAIEKSDSNEKGLWKKMISGNEPLYSKLYFEVLFKAEEAKKELSVKDEVLIEIENDDLDICLDISMNRSELNRLIIPKFEKSYQLLTDLLKENECNIGSISRIILVGGTTYIPYIKEQLSKKTGVFVDSSIDPTTAIVIGAGYYAGLKKSALTEEKVEETSIPTFHKVNPEWIFESQTQDDEELIVGNFSKNIKGYFRIIRQDGGYDSGRIKYENAISMFIPLLEQAKNIFSIQLFNLQNKLVYEKLDIEISHGLYNVLGQPLPADISLEIDGNSERLMECIFEKNTILPSSKTLYKTASKSLFHNKIDSIIINVREGDGGNSASSNLLIGCIEISTQDLDRDIIQGTDIELKFHISESRDLKIDIYIDAINLEINQVFSPSYFHVEIEKVIEEIKYYIECIEQDLQTVSDHSDSEVLKSINKNMLNLYAKAVDCMYDEVTDQKYSIDEEKRKLIQKYDQTTRHINLQDDIEHYYLVKEELSKEKASMSTHQREQFDNICKQEHVFINNGNKHQIKVKIDQVENLIQSLNTSSGKIYKEIFLFLKYHENAEEGSKNKKRYRHLIEEGSKLLETNNRTDIKHIVNQLYSNLTETFIKNNFKSEQDSPIKQSLGLLGLK